MSARTLPAVVPDGCRSEVPVLRRLRPERVLPVIRPIRAAATPRRPAAPTPPEPANRPAGPSAAPAPWPPRSVAPPSLDRLAGPACPSHASRHSAAPGINSAVPTRLAGAQPSAAAPRVPSPSSPPRTTLAGSTRASRCPQPDRGRARGTAGPCTTSNAASAGLNRQGMARSSMGSRSGPKLGDSSAISTPTGTASSSRPGRRSRCRVLRYTDA